MFGLAFVLNQSLHLSTSIHSTLQLHRQESLILQLPRLVVYLLLQLHLLVVSLLLQLHRLLVPTLVRRLHLIHQALAQALKMVSAVKLARNAAAASVFRR